ncbi:mRNA splicing protein SLU7 NDAI_0A03490 [Naumovozyma dairenensis CBS 421]|uniref:Pre-mRNA-splicing factor SLU7 n=1 Tax=Naumovozyma dairenensis (strain ATCC 10597 / BCRC 20456 / CBS 421 / NBRC 0211 / NRRL Y-12639) TaxID=1071378 RepID=G0W3W8_NAUDC|nr:hypothetical protein NDAI_0A03490 [Naumovozyma dairenensis CBS 421]CCD22506.1 hypothetical protein NDAI_0A03490 [Naumovozyma dairenensis CBS 421]
MSGNNNKNKNFKKGPTKQNQHLPQYIKSQPWYYKDSKNTTEKKNDNETSTKEEDYLIHHRSQKHEFDHNDEPTIGSGISDEFITVQSRFRDMHNRNTKHQEKLLYCENCGAKDHLRKDCLERPKKLKKTEVKGNYNHQQITSTNGVLPTEAKIRNEEQMDWDAKKDRWFGYTGKEYNELLENWETKKKNNTQEPTDKENEDDMWDTDEEIELMQLGLYKDSMGHLKKDDENNSNLKHRTAVRLREDRAAYLNDINSGEIKYDPKSRIYKNEEIGLVDEKSKMFRRYLTGEGLELNQLNRFSKQHAREAGIRDEVEDANKINHVLVANPTKYEQLMKEKTKQNLEQEELQRRKEEAFKNNLLEARKAEGTVQSDESKKELKDLYG